jgi:hypothetical protein
LRTRVPATRDDKRQEQREHKRFRQFLLIICHCSRGQHFSEKQNHEPARALTHHAPDRDAHVRFFQRLHAAEFLDVLGGLFFCNVEHVVGCDDPDQHAA